jgi:hypothetical protein
MPVSVSASAAQDLAYYSSAENIGILAPRGWHCFGTSGSGGRTLYVTPGPIDFEHTFPQSGRRLTGSAIQVSQRFGDTSGRDAVAEVVARVFPAYKQFAAGVMELFDKPPGYIQFGPYPADSLKYRSDRVVEYRTPARSDGLGTYSWLEKNETAIDGAAMLVGPASTPDLLLLAVRLSSDQRGLTPAIVAQFELDAAGLHLH